MAVVGGCSSNNGSPPDASRDGVVYDLALDLPPGCPPDAGNSLGVGGHCTRNGHECTNGLVCACDTNIDMTGVTLNGVPCICTIAGINTSTVPGSDPCKTVKPTCGANATCCNYMSLAYYCSPNICLPGGACINFSPPDAAAGN